jgi:hypothetical protein
VQHEIDGKGQAFSRPVLVLRRYNNVSFLGMPLTSNAKANFWIAPVGEHKGETQFGVASQVRTFSAARLTRRLYTITDPNFATVKTALREKLL